MKKLPKLAKILALFTGMILLVACSKQAPVVQIVEPVKATSIFQNPLSIWLFD
mgnify:CR=1 FL=1